MQQSKRRIIKTRAGELGHLDCHYLGKDQIVVGKRRSYLVCVVDTARASRGRRSWTTSRR